MITKITCQHCGNTDTKRAKHYDGSIGYEAIICAVCGSYSDYSGEHLPDEWSKQYIDEKPPMMYKGFLIQRKKTPHQGLKYCAHKLAPQDIFINPLFSYWWQLKAVIDALK